jgi:hypothetical protein
VVRNCWSITGRADDEVREARRVNSRHDASAL